MNKLMCREVTTKYHLNSSKLNGNSHDMINLVRYALTMSVYSMVNTNSFLKRILLNSAPFLDTSRFSKSTMTFEA